MPDPFESNISGLSSPATRHAVITPSDSTDIPTRPRAIKCLGAGNVVVVDELGVEVTYPVVAGEVLQFRAVRIKATGTTVLAGNLIGWW